MTSTVQRLPSKLSFSWQLPVLLFLPSLLQYFGLASSLTLGASVAALVVLAKQATQHLQQPVNRQVTQLSIGTLILLLCAAILLHLLLAAAVRPVDLTRSGLSFIPLTLILVAGYRLAQLMLSARDQAVERAVYASFWLLCAVGLAAIGGLVPPISGTYFKPVFPYTEPSHFALAFLPLLMFGSVSSRGVARLVMLAIGLAMGWALESLTLMAGWLLVALVCLRKTTAFTLLGLVALGAAQLDISYFLTRLDFGSDDPNLSTLVYVQGWQLMAESLRLSSGWGLGFQQLGVHGSSVDASDLIFAVLGENLNLLDGGFTMSKIVSEFGIFGILLLLVYLQFAWRAARGLRHASRTTQPHRPAVLLAHCAVLSFGVELLVRGAGYFSGTTLLLVAGLTVLATRKHAVRFTGTQGAGAPAASAHR